jgi:hypothetical protein
MMSRASSGRSTLLLSLDGLLCSPSPLLFLLLETLALDLLSSKRLGSKHSLIMFVRALDDRC